ncbi:FAD-dependent monooxygenase [Lacisediminihabitans profunda]|uniref:Monooxygenase n=1 Tax=Lacisediminihabitans profunda TaxID=2594790 RepID=A0A5C8UPR1_9MICO|nr:FAD-dependent monooxygenase [Lacisediminihabitans profunda]TXN29334.1 monooxygenase [Lacisediminihabitans profunda]
MAKLDEATVDVLIVGAGPTGLALAGELHARGVSFRIIDRAPTAVHESRALAIQARTLEVLARHGASEELVAAGDTAAVLVMHFSNRTTELKLFGEGAGETAFPYLLFLSQAETERILARRLTESGVVIERGVELVGLDQSGGDVTCTLRGESGEWRVRSRYVVGCDGAHSVVRHASGIGFSGSAFPQTFVLADVEADGLPVGLLHAFPAREGMLFLFPLGSPATWRILVMVPPGLKLGEPSLASVQAMVDPYTGGRVRLHDPVWLTNFSVQSRRADRFRAGRVFLAGDAAHIHSPAGAQGMNTGIQDAVNLGWKLALVTSGLARDDLLDSYEAERLPVARSVLRTTNRAFRVATSTNGLMRFFRPRVAAVAVPLVIRIPALRRLGFRAISQLGIRYPGSPLSVAGRPPLRGGPRPGDRLPDSGIVVNGVPTTIQRSLSSTHFQLVLCGPLTGWGDRREFDALWGRVVRTARLSAGAERDVWVDSTRGALRRLGLGEGETAHYLVRPDGYIGYGARGTDLRGLEAYLRAL